MKKLITWSNVINALFAVLIIVVVISPHAKVIILQGLMKVGLFKAPVGNAEHAQKNVTLTVLPDLTLKDPENKIITLKDQRGKVIIINFWATWCPPCIAEMPSINKMYARYRSNPKVLILAVDADNDFSKSLPFMKTNNYKFPVYNTIGEIPIGWQSNAIPTTIIVDKSGAISARHEGAADYSDDEFYNYLDGLIDN
jgi:thiol-disulfide isomerase/thioredoxin